MWRLAGVIQHVCLKMGLSIEAFIAHLTLVWLFAGMDKFVSLQNTCARESLIADITRVHRGCGLVDVLMSWCIH